MTTTTEKGTPTGRRRSLRGENGGGDRRGSRGGGRGGGGGSDQTLPLLVIALALVLAGVGAFIVSSSYDTPREARSLGANLAINDGASNPLDLNANNSPALVRNPVEEGNLVTAARIDSPTYSCSLSVSFDGGGRWTQTAIPAPRGEKGIKCFAPDAAFSSDGTLYVSYVTLKGRANAPDAAWITRSSDGGKTLETPTETPLGKRAFQVRITADPKAPKRIFLTWLKADELGLYTFSNTGNPIMAIRSDDGGVNWTNPTRVSSPARERVVAPSPAAGSADGELNVLYLDLGDDVLDYGGGHRGQGGPAYDGDWQLVLARSTDNGATWKESVVEDAITPTERFIVFTPPFPSIAVDRASGRTYAAFQDGRGGDADVLLWSLPKGGTDVERPRARERHPAQRRHGAVPAEARGSTERPGRRPVLRPPRGAHERPQRGLAPGVLRRGQDVRAAGEGLRPRLQLAHRLRSGAAPAGSRQPARAALDRQPRVRRLDRHARRQRPHGQAGPGPRRRRVQRPAAAVRCRQDGAAARRRRPDPAWGCRRRLRHRAATAAGRRGVGA